MTNKIKYYLKKLEKEKNIKILWACETGSRAWGFPSTDSDYDIRLIYVHKSNWYLSLNNPKDSLELMLDNNEIDITGWELKKSLLLLNKSNAPLLERIQSPMVYLADYEFIKEFRTLSLHHYSRITTIHHYLSITKKFLEDLESKEFYKLKAFFYTLRSALVCKWILEKETAPPIVFSDIYLHLKIKKELQSRINELITFKATVDESYLHQGEDELINLIKQCVNDAELNRESLPAASGKLNDLNNIFRKYITKYDH